MTTNYKYALKTGLIVLALTVGACGSSSSSTGTGGKGGSTAGSGGSTAGSGGSTAGSGGSTAGSGGSTAGSGGSGGSTGVAGSDGGAPTDGGDGGGLTPAQINDMIINGPGAFGADYGTMINHAAPKVYSNGTCM
jgi:hypothetical protein